MEGPRDYPGDLTVAALQVSVVNAASAGQLLRYYSEQRACLRAACVCGVDWWHSGGPCDGYGLWAVIFKIIRVGHKVQARHLVDTY